MRSPKPNILWSPNSEAQRKFLATTARVAMLGGGLGGGKTSALLVAAALQCANSKSRAVIFRRDYPSLRQIIASSFSLFLPMRGVYNKGEHTWRFPSGGTITFSHLEDAVAVYQHAGAEYSFLGFDEAQQLPGDSVDSLGQPINSAFAFLQTRLRAPLDSKLRLECRLTATPNGPGAAWIRRYFKIPDSSEGCEHVDETTGFRRVYIHSVAADNPALSASYARQLADLPSSERRALLHGDWTALAGAIFREWDFQVHTCDDFEIPEEWPMWRAADDGYASAACVLWFAHDEIHDVVYVCREFYAKQQTPEMLAREVRAIDAEFEQEMDGNVIDSASFANTGMGGSRGEVMNQLGCGWSPCAKGAGSRVSGWSAIHSRLALKDGHPGLKIFRGCKNLIRTLPQLCYDRTNPEDIADGCEDHCADALRYGLTRKKIEFRYARVTGI